MINQSLLFNTDNTTTIKISTKWLSHNFECTVDYIKSTCHGRCCTGGSRVLIALLPDEEEWHRNNGMIVENGLLQSGVKKNRCPYQTDEGLCSIHDSPHKPFGCIISPFRIIGTTLVIGNRYSLMRCHGHGLPSYITFRASLDKIFGAEESQRIVDNMPATDDFTTTISKDIFNKLKQLQSTRQSWINDNKEQ
jgi:Fe-S-cluster containining protein